MENNRGEQILKISIEVNLEVSSNKDFCIIEKNDNISDNKTLLPSKFKNKSITWNSDIENKCNTIIEKVLINEGKKLNVSQIIMDAITEKFEKY